MADRKEVKRLQEIAYEMRKKLLHLCGSYEGPVHIGGDLSMTDLLIGLFHHGLNVNPNNTKDPARDRFLLCKGHGADKKYLTPAKRIFKSLGINLARHRYRNVQFEGQNETVRTYVRRMCQHGLCCYAALRVNYNHRLAAGLYGSSLCGVGA